MINLRNFSHFSLGESILRPYDIVKLAKENNQSAVAMIDRMNLFGALEFSIYAIKEKIKPIFGVILKVDLYGNIPVFIKNSKGYKEISELLTTFYKDKQEFITSEQFINLKNVIVLWGGEESKYQDNIDGKMKLTFLKEVFRENLYIEIQDNSNQNLFLQLALDLHIPIVYTHNAYFENGKFEAYYTFTCIYNGTLYSKDEFNNSPKRNNYFLNKEELKNSTKYEEGLLNSESIGRRCNFYLKQEKPMIPEIVPPNEAGSILTKLVKEKLELRLKKEKINPKDYSIYYDRIDRELEVIISRGFANYFLVTQDFVNKAKEMGISVGGGRGSGTGSLVSYSLGITNVDPIKFNLIFERFLNPERISMPDLDIDFCQEKRGLIINYLREKYGEENVAQIVTFGTLKSRIVVRDVGRVLMIPLKLVDSICKFIPQDQVRPLTLKEAVDLDTKLMSMFNESDQLKKLLDISIQLEGLVRHMSLHAAGVVIYKKQDNSYLASHIPLYRIHGDEELCTQFSMKYVEMAGLVKFDFLGLQTLTLIQKTCELIKKRHNIDLDMDYIPYDDKNTFDFINKLNLSGIFQLDSMGMKTVISDLKPNNIDDIIAGISLFRPGPMKFIPQYIQNKQNPEKITYLHPLLEPILKVTYGVIVYQEQVLEIAVKCAGYSLGEADNLRRAMGKKILKEMEQQELKFIQGAKKKGIIESISKELFNRISDFAGYGFNKSHAAPYSLISYMTAYLKTYYTLEFMTILMTLDKQDTNKLIIYVNDLKKLKIKVLPPHINKSESDFSIEENSIRFGFSGIKNMGEAFSNAIVNERNLNGKYENMDSFLHRNMNHLNKRQLEFLIYSRALDDLNVNNILLLENINSIIKGETIIDMKQTLDKSIIEKYNMDYWEMNSLGFFLNTHPLQKEDLKILGLQTIQEILATNYKKGTLKIAGVIYDIVKKKTHYSNRTYIFLTLFDTTGMFEVTLFSETIEKYIHLIEKKQIIVMDINFEKKDNIVKLICYKVYNFHEYKQSLCTNLYIKTLKNNFPTLKNILEEYNKEENYVNKVILQYRNKNYLLPYNIKVTKELLDNLKQKNILFSF